MKNVLGIMDLYEDDKQIRTLTTKRPVATLPFAGRYRLLDFALSSMVNSGITKNWYDDASKISFYLRPSSFW